MRKHQNGKKRKEKQSRPSPTLPSPRPPEQPLPPSTQQPPPHPHLPPGWPWLAPRVSRAPCPSPAALGMAIATPWSPPGPPSWQHRHQLAPYEVFCSWHASASHEGMGDPFPPCAPQPGTGGLSLRGPLNRWNTWGRSTCSVEQYAPPAATCTESIWSHLLVGVDAVSDSEESDSVSAEAVECCLPYVLIVFVSHTRQIGVYCT